MANKFAQPAPQVTVNGKPNNFIGNVLQKAFGGEKAWENFMAELGYERKTTFYSDFIIAELCGNALHDVEDTFNRSFESCKKDIKYITELYMVFNARINILFEEGNKELFELYSRLYQKIDEYVLATNEEGTEYLNYSKKDVTYFIQTTD